MSAQINLFHPRFLRQHDALTLPRVALATIVVYAALGTVAAWAWREASGRVGAAAAVQAELETLKAGVEAETNAAGSRKADPQLQAELERAQASLRRRADIVSLLDSSVAGTADGFSGYMRGFARQVPDGLWLTGFIIGEGGADMEVRGRTLNPAALPEYIRRLGAESAFRGRQFSSLTMNRVAAPPAPRVAGQELAVPPAPTPGTPAVDFVLSPKPVEPKEGKQ